MRRKLPGKIETIPEEREAFRSITTQGGNGCPEICGKAARMVTEMILDTQNNAVGGTA